ncbi:MAG: hypothetical protein LQ344_001466 [Seirophora lacunosa]|nr:MAG: hypothetical protein LQ344_001466 [Seirophora lacunosa]
MSTKDLRDQVFDLEEQLQDEKRRSESQATQLAVYGTQMQQLRSQLRERDRALNDLKLDSTTAVSKKAKEQDEIIAILKKENAVYRENDSILRDKTEAARSSLRGLLALIETKDSVLHSVKLESAAEDQRAPAQASTSATTSTPPVSNHQPPADIENGAKANTEPISASASTQAHPGTPQTRRKHVQEGAEDAQEPQVKRTRTSEQPTRVDTVAQTITATIAGPQNPRKAKLSQMMKTTASKSAALPPNESVTGYEVMDLEDVGDGDYVDPQPQRRSSARLREKSWRRRPEPAETLSAGVCLFTRDEGLHSREAYYT